MNRRAEIGAVVTVRAADDGFGEGEGREEEGSEEDEDGGLESHGHMVALVANGHATRSEKETVRTAPSSSVQVVSYRASPNVEFCSRRRTRTQRVPSSPRATGGTMKASKQCPKCNSLKVGRLEEVWDVDTERSGETFKSQPVGFVVKKRQLGKRLIEENVPTGELEAYLCASCGYFETYVKHAETIPFDELDGFSWLNPAIGEEGPYR